MSSAYFGDRSNPMSPEILPSTSPSPHIIRTPLHGHAPKQRSASVNSTGSNHQSILSLDSPRNSIVSLDDANVRPLTRNNSTASIQSASVAKDTAVLSRTRVKLKGHHTSAVFSDEDSEIERPAMPIHSTQLLAKKVRRRQDSDRIDPIKQDFQFQFSSPPTHPATRSPVPPKADAKVDDSSPSPLSLIATDPQATKKVKTAKTNLSQSLLKKKIYSKDIQLELAPAVTSAIKEEHRFERRPPVEFRQGEKEEPKDKGLFSDAPILSALNHQSQLISEMNRKWNRSLVVPKRAKYKLEGPVHEARLSRKRSRGYSFDGDDEESFNEL